MRKSAIFKILMLIVAAAFILASCSSKPVNSKPGRIIVENERQPIKPRLIKIEDEYPYFDYSISMPVVEKTEGRSRDVVFYRDGGAIYGRITVPKGHGPFKTIIIVNGLYAPLGRYSDKAEHYAEHGFAVIEFICQNGNPPDSGDDPEWLGNFIVDQILDLYAVIDSCSYFSEIDTSNIYVYGHSMGGMVASYAGTFRQDDIKGLILVDPSFYAADIMWFENEKLITTDIYPLFKTCKIPVVIFTGTEGSFGEDPEYFKPALAAFPDVQFIVIEGATHGMNGVEGEHLVDLSVEVIASWG